MNKSDIVSRVAAQSSLSKAAADSLVSAVFTAIGNRVKTQPRRLTLPLMESAQ